MSSKIPILTAHHCVKPSISSCFLCFSSDQLETRTERESPISGFFFRSNFRTAIFFFSGYIFVYFFIFRFKFKLQLSKKYQSIFSFFFFRKLMNIEFHVLIISDNTVKYRRLSDILN